MASNSEQDTLETELTRILIDGLMLEDVAPEELAPDAPLFETLGLDSIDALEISTLLNQHYGVQLQADDERNHKIFSTIESLAGYVREQRSS